ncbi:MAG TPA: peptide chain release factor N(5)-glutamine methyltransferase [Pirellulaceae bacterium]|nr:peptide chain release factor N(5)-glutamine methyltransferase [Pirellulaceae bacterium]
MSVTEVWTIGRLLNWTADYLKKSGAESPRLDAEVLLAHARGCQRIELYTAFTDTADDKLRGEFRELVKQRAAGKPVAYLVGRREFYSLALRVSPDVLIPRPETEFAVIAVLDLIKQQYPDADVAVADVGTGSGAISIAIARHCARAKVMAIDKSDAALAVARQNVADHKLNDRIELVSSDLLDAVPAERQLDFVVSNPPYVSESEWAALSREVRDHEPRLALVGGPTGTEVIGRLIPQAAERLRGGGWLIIEISPMIESAVNSLITADGRFEAPATIKDLAGHARIVKARRAG